MIISKLIERLNGLIENFSTQTGSYSVDFTENKKFAEWSLVYHLIKIDFVLTKKEKILCPVSTLFCRIYLGKNDVWFYHLPELMEYLDSEDFKCYYFPYVESEKRIEACFSVLAEFIKKHYDAINQLAQNIEKRKEIQASKLKDMLTILKEDAIPPELEEFWICSYETCVLLPRYVGDGAYRKLLCGKYEKSLKLYEKTSGKGMLTNYECRLLQFIKELKTDYVFISEECNSICKAVKWNSSSECKAMLEAVLICGLLLGPVFCGVVAIINSVASEGALYYVGMPWYYALIFAGLPIVFGGIAFGNDVRKKLHKKLYQESGSLDEMVNPKWVFVLSKTIFVISLVFMLYECVCTSFMGVAFYEDFMRYDEEGKVIPTKATIFYYEDLEKVYYSEGIYNDFGNFIDRPSYLVEFEDGMIWDSDGNISVEQFEEHILPILEPYYDELEKIKSRDELVK